MSDEFESAPAGAHGAVLTRAIDNGTHEGNFGPKRKLMLTWELDEKMADGRPFLVNQWYTMSFHPKSNLRKLIEAWRGARFEGDSVEFEVESLLGRPCLLNVVHNDRGYADVASISPLPKGMARPDPVGPLLLFDFDAPDWDVFDQLSEGMKERLRQTPEFKGEPIEPKSAPAQDLPKEFNDDLPW